MLAKTPLGTQMYHWVLSKDPNESYNWSNNCYCACAQFAESIGKTSEWLKEILEPGAEWYDLNHIARGQSGWLNHSEWTFGKLAERLSVYA